jgi:phosphoheptose isomerase
MVRFPSSRPAAIGSYFDAYVSELTRASASVSRGSLDHAHALLIDCLESDGRLFAAGNGGSAGIANHLVCDYGKGIRADTGLRPRVQSLSSGPEILTAIGNDIGYPETFSSQLEAFARPGDLLMTISSSGDSENIVRAIQWAKANGMRTIAFTGFDGGRSAKLADVSLHVRSENYGIIEDVHQSLIHALAQYVRLLLMAEDLIPNRKF